MRISELARRAGVSKQTIHFYLREGLLPRPRKAGRNMAFYDETHLERIALIKRLQHERYLPLGVIKRVLAERRAAGPELDLLAELLSLPVGADAPADEGTMTRAAFLRRTGVSAEMLDLLASEGLVAPRGQEYARKDARVVALIAEAQRAAGFSPEFAARVFGLYRRRLAEMAEEEARLYAQAILAAARPLAYVEGIRRAREATNRYLLLERARLIEREIERYLAEVEAAAAGDGEPSLFPASPSLRAAGADDALATGARDDDPGALEARLRAEAPRSLARALLGAALVRKARRAVQVAGGRHAMKWLTEGLAELAASETAPAGDAREELAAQLVRGRTYAALPRFFGARERGTGELLRVADAGVRGDATARWMAANAAYFAGCALAAEPGRAEEARAAFARAAELDQDGPLAARARERMKTHA